MGNINEAEFQADIKRTICKAFPLLPSQDIKLEHYLNLKLGHHNITIDGNKSEKDNVKGRYDILIKYNDQPLMIVELKAPDVSILDDDTKQALSYARLLTPKMAPLAAVTNGDECKICRVYDGKNISQECCFGENLEKTVSSAAKLAAGDCKKAISTLLGYDHIIWKTFFSEWNKKSFELLSGYISDLPAPLCSDFSIPRTVVGELNQKTQTHSKPIVIHGEPLSGITNILVQYCKNNLAPVLFIDYKTRDETFDVIRHIASNLTKELNYQITREDVFTWFNTLPKDILITIVSDGIPNANLNDLLDLVQDGKINLIIGCNTTLFESFSKIPGRIQNSQLGKSSEIIKINDLSDAELKDALDLICEKYDALFYNGISHSRYYRYPRNLRMQISHIQKAGNIDSRQKLVLYPLISPSDLDNQGEIINSNSELENDYSKLAEAYLQSIATFDEEPSNITIYYKRLIIFPDVAEKILTTSRIDHLKAAGILEWVKIGDSELVYFIRIWELLLYSIGKNWEKIFRKHKSNEGVCETLRSLLAISEKIPHGALTLAFSILSAAKYNDNILNVVIPHLIDNKPTESTLSGGAKVAFLTDAGPCRYKLPDNFKEKCMENTHPWLVLSYISELPFSEGNKAHTLNPSIFVELGAYENILCPVDLEPVKIHTHNLNGDKEILCHDCGIIEPIQQSMLKHALSFPDEFISLTQNAKQNNRIHLAWRLFAIARVIKTCTERKISDAGIEAENILKDICQVNFEPQKKRKIGRNEKCPCGSGQKYKKCCGK